ncbi:MAG: OmpA family protein [Betaproteobacteria bacterium]|nr:OmpA family protein [Betaproteobacteria bacterium]
MRSTIGFAASLLVLTCAPAGAVDLNNLPNLGELTNKPFLDNVNKSLADQQIKDGQFEFKTGKAEFAAGNEKRISGLLKILTESSKTLKTAFPKLKVTAEGHTDADGTAAANQKLSVARAKTVCAALKAKGMKLPCVPSGVGSLKALVSPEKSAADKQKNRRVLVQLAK